MRKHLLPSILIAGVALLGLAPAQATVVKKSYDFNLEKWGDIDQADGPITLHRARLTTTDLGMRSMSAKNALNDEFLQRISFQLEFSNDGDKRYKSYITVRILDADGNVIDGFGDEEGLEPHKARGMVTRSVATSKYGLRHARTLVVEVNLNP